ncbi:MAG: DUF362 domain-containing protein [Planctomycetota bacterium]|jgi:uncharacterized protein (DUF362 family)
MYKETDKKINRRRLLTRAGKAAGAIAATGVVSYLLYDEKGPKPASNGEDIVKLPDFSIQPKDRQTIAVTKGADRVKTVRKSIDLLGGIERFIKPGETVMIKPNVAFASSPMLSATTNPELIAEVIKLCYDRGKAKKVYVTDNPINEPVSCFTLSGIARAASNTSAKVVMPRDNLFKNTTLEKGRLIHNWPILYEPFVGIDKLIGIAPVKDHHRSRASMTMKNWYGLLGGRRNIFHQDINTIIAELSMMVKPTMVILDGTQTMITNGPTGGSVSDLKTTNTMIVSCDMVAADSFGCELLGLKAADLPYLALAEKLGAGTVNYQKLKPKFSRID